jgi:2-polyprenyl-6-methoxyphenol hydroxylase-like FAD-dependent oxidoreductase
MNMPAAQTALVVGGGIAGPVTATALAMAGIEAAVYEARPADPAAANGIGGSLALEPNGLAALRIVDADDAVRAAAAPITRSMMSIGSKPGREMPTPQGLPPRQLIDRGALHHILRDRAERAGVRIHDGRKLIHIEERPDGVTAHFADGTNASADVLIGADGVHSTVRKLIDSNAPSARYLGLLGFEGAADDAADTAALEPGTMTFAFGRRAYYLYWKRPDGRIGWGANLPSPQHLSLKEARAVPPEDWLHTLRTTYADDVPGARLAAETTSATLQAVGGLHIMPPVPHWHRDRLVRAVQQHRAGRVAGHGERDPTGPVPARFTRCDIGIRRLRAAAPAAGREDRRARRPYQPCQGAGCDRAAPDAAADSAHGQDDEHRQDDGRRTELHDRLGRAGAGERGRIRF